MERYSANTKRLAAVMLAFVAAADLLESYGAHAAMDLVDNFKPRPHGTRQYKLLVAAAKAARDLHAMANALREDVEG